jgi:hypothetical protein
VRCRDSHTKRCHVSLQQLLGARPSPSLGGNLHTYWDFDALVVQGLLTIGIPDDSPQRGKWTV